MKKVMNILLSILMTFAAAFSDLAVYAEEDSQNEEETVIEEVSAEADSEESIPAELSTEQEPANEEEIPAATEIPEISENSLSVEVSSEEATVEEEVSVISDEIQEEEAAAEESEETAETVSGEETADEITEDSEMLPEEQPETEDNTELSIEETAEGMEPEESEDEEEDETEAEESVDLYLTPALLELPAMSGNPRNDAVALARSQEGYREGSGNDNIYELILTGSTGKGDDSAWCVYFATWCSITAGAGRSQFRSYGGTNTNLSWFQENARWHQKNNNSWDFGYTSSDGTVDYDYPGYPGDHVIVDTDGFKTKEPDHTAILIDQDDQYWYTIEGNISNQVVSKSYSKSTLKSSYDNSTLIGFMEVDYGDNPTGVTRPALPNPWHYCSTPYGLFTTSMVNTYSTYVKWIQQALNVVMGTSLDVDGYYGTNTANAVKQFQSAYGLEVDGEFGSQSIAKMVSILNSKGYYETSTSSSETLCYMDGTYSFDAYIISEAKWLPITISSSNNAELQYEKSSNGDPSQVFHFDVVGNGKASIFKITSYKNGCVLDVSGGGSVNNANIQVYESNNSTAQQWYLLSSNQNNTSVRLSPLCAQGSTSLDFKVLDVQDRNYTPGGNIQLYEYKNNEEAQKFTLWIMPGIATPSVSVNNTSGTATISWNATHDTRAYDVEIYKGSSSVGGAAGAIGTGMTPYKTVSGVTGTSTEVSLEPGTYYTRVVSLSSLDNSNTNRGYNTVTKSFTISTGISLNKSSTTINVGNTETLTATVKPSTAANKTVTWTSSNTGVATVSNGVVKGVSEGTATITAKNSYGNSATCTVKVKNVAVTGVSLNYANLPMKVGESVTLTPTVSPSNATNKNVIWKSSDTSVATVTNGKVTGVKAGIATITVTTVDGSKTATCTVKVTTGQTGIVINDGAKGIDYMVNSDVRMYGWMTRTLTVKDLSTGETIPLSDLVITSSDYSVASIDSEGTVTGTKDGRATITVKTKDGRYSDTIIAAGYELRMEPSQLIVQVDETIDWPTLLIDSLGWKVTKNSTDSLYNLYTNNNTQEVLSIDKENKTLTGDAEGTVDCIIQLRDLTGTVFTYQSEVPPIIFYYVTVTVVPKKIAVTSINVSPSSQSMTVNDQVQLTANVQPVNATDKTVTWSSSNTSVATVSSKGLVTAVGAGTATITAKSGTKTATCKVTVTKPLTSIKLSRTSLSLAKGKSSTLSVTYNPTDTTDSKTVTWSTSDKTVATVSNGKVTAVGAGTATITAKVGTKKATCKVTVTVPLTSIKLNKTTLSLEKGAAQTLKVTYTPADTTDSKTVTWSTSDKTVATVSSAGKVTAVKAGTATITAKVGTKTATCKVTVTVPLTSISLNKKSMNVVTGKTGTLTVKYNPADATEDKAVTWTSSDKTVATVSSAGKVTGKTPGTATITAKTAGGKSAKCTIRVLFTDVTDSTQFYYEYIYSLLDKGIVSGYFDGTFRPYDACNRASVVTFLWRAANRPEPKKLASFSDMTGNADFDKAISWASEQGITTGYEDGTFRPYTTCNRAAIMTFLWRYAGKPSVKVTNSFSDMTGNSDFDKAISWGVANGITTGYEDGTFRPWNTCNRLAIASFLGRYLEK